MQQASPTTIDHDEIAKFSAISDSWWDVTGPFKPLHEITPLRIGYIADQIAAHMQRDMSELSILDVGCGGGLASEPLARLCTSVTAIDASPQNIAIANAHAEQSGLKIDYQCCTAEGLADDGKQYDCVVALEIIEHVADVECFLEALHTLTAPDGLLFITTLNRTLKSLLLAKIGAEYILRWLPIGTHDWNKFLKPSDIVRPLEQMGSALKDVSGMVYHPLSRTWSLSPDDVSINYLLCMQKNA